MASKMSENDMWKVAKQHMMDANQARKRKMENVNDGEEEDATERQPKKFKKKGSFFCFFLKKRIFHLF